MFLLSMSGNHFELSPGDDERNISLLTSLVGHSHEIIHVSETNVRSISTLSDVIGQNAV